MKHFRLILLLTVIVLHGLSPIANAQDTLNVKTKTDSIIDWANTSASFKLNQEQIQRLPFRQMSSFGMLAPSAYQQKGSTTYYYGVGSSGNNYFIDGMQLSDVTDFPTRIVESYELYTRQAPIRMGFNIGGITAIGTLNSQEFEALVDVNTNQAYDMSSVTGQLYINIPFAGKKKNTGKTYPTLLISGKYTTTNNTDPVWKKTQQLKGETLAYLQENPLRPSGNGYGTYRNADFVSAEDFTDRKVPENSGQSGLYPFVKLQIPTTKNGNLSLGNYSVIDETQVYNHDNSMFNSSKNAIKTRRNYDNYIRWSHNLNLANDIRINYELNLQYSNHYQQIGDPDHGKNFLDYGYLGKFTTYKMPTFEIGSVYVDSMYYSNLYILNSWHYDTLVTFEPSVINPYMAAYTSNYFSIYEGQPAGHYQNMDFILLGGGLVNGSTIYPIFGLYNGTGTSTSGYNESSAEKLRVALNLNADIKTHHLSFGGEYNQENLSHFAVNPNGLWRIMDGLTNFHLWDLDLDNPQLISHEGHADTVIYYPKYNAHSQRDFDKNLRMALGLPVDGVDFILINSYDRQNNTINYYDKYGVMKTLNTPENLFSLDLFSAEELLNGGLPFVQYVGYDYTGKKQNSSDPYAFFEDWSISPNKPIYGAAYLQDEFNFKKLHVNVGVRVDIYNANRPVLKDMYSLFPAYDVNEAKNMGEIEFTQPGNIAGDYVVYVNKVIDPTRVVGFRDGDTWYAADGTEIQDLWLLDFGNGVSPYLTNPQIDKISDEDWNPGMTFTDYSKTINVLPQISLDYPLTNRINLYTHYNSFTQNPRSYNDFRPDQYYNWDYASYFTVDNSALKPMRAGKLFAGITWLIWKNLVADVSYLNITIDNYMYVKEIDGGYPTNYTTVVNSDKRIMTQGIETSLNWTNTTNSGLSGGLNITNLTSDESDLNYFQVSNLVANVHLGYRFGDALHFSGPSWANIGVLHGLSANFFYQYRHGMPYQYTENNIVRGIKHMPPVKLCNLNIQKDMALGKKSLLNVYLTIENVFNFKNVFNVYPATGQGDNDGFLTNPAKQSYINAQTNPDSFRLLYQLHLYDPSYYDIPRIWRIGIVLKY